MDILERIITAIAIGGGLSIAAFSWWIVLLYSYAVVRDWFKARRSAKKVERRFANTKVVVDFSDSAVKE